MSFPYTSVLDNFGTPGANLGAAWGIVKDYSALIAASGVANYGAHPAYPAYQYYGTQYARNQEVYATIKDDLSTVGDIAFLGLRIQNPLTSPDGYRVEFRQAGGNVDAYLVRESTGAANATALDLGITAFTVGDKVGASAQGSTIRVYYYDSTAATPAWAKVGSWTDTGVGVPGYIGIGFKATAELTQTALFDAFGGGYSAVGREEAIREEIFDVVDAVSDLGSHVYNRARWSVHRDTFMSIAKETVDSTDKLRVFWVMPVTITPEQITFQDGTGAGGYLRNYRYAVRGWVGMKDADSTELDALDLATQIMEALDGSAVLHNGQNYYDCSLASLDTFEPRTFGPGSYLTHAIEITLTISDWVD